MDLRAIYLKKQQRIFVILNEHGPEYITLSVDDLVIACCMKQLDLSKYEHKGLVEPERILNIDVTLTVNLLLLLSQSLYIKDQ